MDNSYLMKLELNDKEYFFSTCISEFWIMDLIIPNEIKSLNYNECSDLEMLTDIINYWLDNKSDSELNKDKILKYLHTIPEINGNLSTVCYPELIYYEFNGVNLNNIIVSPDNIVKIDSKYKVDLKDEGVLYINDKDIIQKISEDLNDIWDEESDEYIEETICLLYDSYIFLTKSDEKKLNEFISSVVKNLSEIHFKN